MNPENLDDDLLSVWAVSLNEPTTPAPIPDETNANTDSSPASPDVIPFPPALPISSSTPPENPDDNSFLLRGYEPSDEGFHPRLKRFDEAA